MSPSIMPFNIIPLSKMALGIMPLSMMSFYIILPMPLSKRRSIGIIECFDFYSYSFVQ
jgi:hypothetical protein